jgi:hypothetical protein
MKTFLQNCLLFLTATSVVYAQQAAHGPPEGIVPQLVHPSQIATAPAPRATFQIPLGFEQSAAHNDELKHLAPAPFPSGGTQVNVDTTTTAPVASGGFVGMTQSGWIPYDAAIAVGPNHVVVMTNARWSVYSKTGTLLRGPTSFGTWWGSAAGEPFDPKCFYDAVAGRFVMLTTSAKNNLANFYVSVSQTSDPTGAWYNYTLDDKLDGTTATSNWGDYPGLGYDDNNVYIGANQYSLGGNSFQYPKVRVLKKSQLYAGTSVTWTDFTRLTNGDGTLAFTVRPARCLSTSTSEYLLATRPSGGSSVTVYRIDNPASGPVIARTDSVSVGSYSVPPDAQQPGTGTLVATNDCRTQDCVWKSGLLYTGFTEKYGTRYRSQKNVVAAVRYLKIDTSTAFASKDITYTASGIHMYFPAVTVDSRGNMVMVYSRSSSTEYASLYYTGMTTAESNIEPSARLKAGVGVNTTGRWGDYSGVANDGTTSIWLYGGWANSGNAWATWVGQTSFP